MTPAAVAAPSAGCDWAGLPSQLLGLIAERLTVPDYARFRCVCASWAFALFGEGLPYLPRAPQAPWLMIPSELGELSEACTFFGLTDARTYRFAPVPEIRGKRCTGSQNGWLVTVGLEGEVHLLNPLTRTHIPLPPVTSHPAVEAVRHPSTGSISHFLVHNLIIPAEGPDSYPPKGFRDVYFRKVVFFSTPLADDFVAVAIYGLEQDLAFARAGDQSWTRLKRLIPPLDYGFSDAVFQEGKLYAMTTQAEVQVIDFSEPEREPKVEVLAKRIGVSCAAADKYIVFSSGDLLLVWREGDMVLLPDGRKTFKTSKLRVTKFDPKVKGDPKACWVPVKHLGDRCLFIGSNCSLSISARDIPGLRPNCIYFTDYFLDFFFTEEGRKSIRDVGMFDLEKESLEPCYPPEVELLWPPPIWMTPAVR